MKQVINSIEELRVQRDELLAVRDKKKVTVFEKLYGFSRPLNLVYMIAKPVAKSVSWLPMFISVAKVVYSIVKNKKR